MMGDIIQTEWPFPPWLQFLILMDIQASPPQQNQISISQCLISFRVVFSFCPVELTEEPLAYHFHLLVLADHK